MILRLEIILLVMPYERKIITFYEKTSKLTKNNTFNNDFYNRIFRYHRFLPIFQKLLDFHETLLIFSRKILSTTLLFPIFKISKKSSNTVI